MNISVELALHLGSILGVAVVAFVTLRSGLNGQGDKLEQVQDDVGEIKRDIKGLVASDGKQNERIGVVEANQEAMRGWVRRLERQVERGGGS